MEFLSPLPRRTSEDGRPERDGDVCENRSISVEKWLLPTLQQLSVTSSQVSRVMGGAAQGLCSIDSIAFVRGCVETNEGGNKSCPEGLCLFVSRDEKEQIVRAIGC